jgi:ribosomal protein S18 acetylase RimI-like enzyme
MHHCRKSEPKDALTILHILEEHWGSTSIASRGKLHDASKLPALIVEQNGTIIGLLTYKITGRECEIVTLNATDPRKGIGTILIEELVSIARMENLRRIWLITTNDNVDAMRFYQRRNFHLVAVHRNAIKLSRKLKPSIPLNGSYGILLRDEIELEFILGQ